MNLILAKNSGSRIITQVSGHGPASTFNGGERSLPQNGDYLTQIEDRQYIPSVKVRHVNVIKEVLEGSC